MSGRHSADHTEALLLGGTQPTHHSPLSVLHSQLPLLYQSDVQPCSALETILAQIRAPAPSSQKIMLGAETRRAGRSRRESWWPFTV